MTARKLRVVANIAMAAVMLIVCIDCCSGKPPSAVLSIAQGSIQVNKAGTGAFIQGSIGMELEPGDIVEAGNNSAAVVIFFDGSTIELQANTRLEISSLAVEKFGVTRILLKQKVGETISRVIKLADPKSSYEIETISAVATVRGTTMIVSVAFNGLSSVGNQEGKASVIAQGVEVEVPQGSHSTVAPGQPPSQPRTGVRPIDSLINDPRATVISDPCGDVADFAPNKKAADLKTAWALMEEDYLYVAIQLCDTFDSSLLRNYFADLYINNDELVDYSIGVRPYRFENQEAGQAWALVYGGTGSSDWDMIAVQEAPEVTAYWELDSGLLEMVIPTKAYHISDNVQVWFRTTGGDKNFDLMQSSKLTLAEAK
jgi:hypothetical protein